MARRGQSGGGSGDESRWLTTYGDAVTLLLAFFVMLYAISQVDAQKFQLLVSGLQDPFKNKSAVEGLLESGDGIVGQAFRESPVGMEGTPGIQGIDIRPGPVTTSPPTTVGSEDTNTLDSYEELVQVRDALAEALADYGINPEISLDMDQRGLVVSIATDDVLFASGSAELRPAGRHLLGVIAPILNGFDNEIRVEGHTDNVPLDQNGYSNWDLSSDRALAVLKLLQDDHHVNPRRLSATGYGEQRPLASNDTEQGRQTNRRVVLVIVAATSPTPES